jgi:NNP family nitrate/nitrite transporter-like MFS transporter
VPDTLYLRGWIVRGCAICAISVRFSMTHKKTEQELYNDAIAERRNLALRGGVAAAN